MYLENRQEGEGKVKISNVIHPGHYNIPGRKECIEEMVDKFGMEAVETFCALNAYKYIYRHELKNGQEDLDKAKNYQKMLLEYIREDPRFKIADHYGLEVQMQQLIEEMAELTQVICKDKRAKGQGQALGEPWKYSDIHANLVEELADVKLVLEQVIYLMGVEKDIQEIIQEKTQRTLERMVEE